MVCISTKEFIACI